VQLAAIAFLSERRASALAEVITQLETAIASGVVPNALFVPAKDTLNRAVTEAAEAFLATGPHAVGRDGQAHHQSDWWLGAYDHDAFVSGLHTLPIVLKRAQTNGLTDYAAFVAGLLPLRTLLETAKPLIKKKGELPVVKTAKQIAAEADQMTCQCCGRGIFAATGTIAHHGYERPGGGYQTASCFGAKALPWEVSRNRLGELVTMLKRQLENQRASRSAVIAETGDVRHLYSVKGKFERESRTVWFNRATFESVKADKPEAFKVNPSADFEFYKTADVSGRDAAIKRTKADIVHFTARFDGWKQTHERLGGQWVAL
jgi:hypothetical protein